MKQMELSLEWQSVLSRYFDCIVIVEGKKDAAALRELGFLRVYTIHETGISVRERIEYISQYVGKKDSVCILTDLDKKGKQLYIIIQKELQAIGVRLDSSLRALLCRLRVSHVEGLDSYIETHTTL